RDHLILGTFDLRAGRFAEAERHFEAALTTAPLERDRRFAQERLIASHRAAGTLDRLAERWLAEPDRSEERVEALVAVLRELRRPEEALSLLVAVRGEEASAAVRSAPTQRDLQREIIGLALECGRDEDVEATYADLIEREPTK